MSANFNVQFRINEKTQTRVIRLTDASSGFTLAKGNFSVTFPDGSTRIKTEWTSPDITSPAAYIDILAVTNNSGAVITGAYKIDFIALDASDVSYSASYSFDFNWIKPTNSITDLSDVIIPQVQFKDNASYSPIGSFTGTVSRVFSTPFPSTSEVAAQPATTTTSSTLTPVYSGNYYEGVYSVSNDVSCDYAHGTNSWLTINYIELFTKSVSIKKCPNQLGLIGKLNTYRGIIEAYKEKNDTQFNLLSEQYDLAIALYSHIIARYETSTQDGSEGQLRELLSILEPYSGTYSYQTTRMLPFELAASGANSFNISDGTNTDSVALGSTVLFSGGNAALKPSVSNNQVDFTPVFGSDANTFAQGNDSRFHNAVTIGTANGLSLASQVLSLALSTASTSGAISASDKAKLDGIAAGANVGTVTSVGISAPSAFSVTNSPITSSGVINISATGNPLQYITGAGALATLNTSVVPEGTNLYFTNARGRAAISVSGSLSYNATAGVISYTTPSETDPIFVASAAYGITLTNISNWNTAYGWGNHAAAGYLTSFTETDPIFVASPSYGITNTNISNWNTAYGWGNHALAGYLTGITSGQITTALGYTPENAANKGVANGYASLDGAGLVPSTQLPSYVDDVLEYADLASLPVTGTTGKIYVTLDTNKIYRWSGTVYVEISSSAGGGGTWGSITGTLSNQVDLQSALNAKQNQLNGTGFVVANGTTISYDGNTYLTTSAAATTYVPYSGANASVNLGEYGIKAGYFQFDLTPTGTPTGVGTMYWDAFYRTFAVVDGTGLTTLQGGQEDRTLVHNNTGATLTDGQVVYIINAVGELPSVGLASNASESLSSVTLGVVTETIAHGDNGMVTTSGVVHGLNTLAYTEGAPIWLGATAGTFTTTKPTSPAHLVLIGYVIKNAGGNGSIYVKIQNTQELNECSDVLFAALANNDGLFYDSATGLWKNKTIAAVLGYTPYNAANPSNYIALTALSSTATGLTYTNTTGVFSLTAGYVIPTTTEESNWNTAYGWGNHASAGYLTTSAAASTYQPLDGDLTAIAALAGTSGFLKKTAADTWALDTNTYLTSFTETDPVYVASSWYSTTNNSMSWDAAYAWGNHASAGYLTTSVAASTYQPLDGDLTAIAAIAGTSGLLKKTAADTWSLDTSAYITGITSGMVTTALGYTPVTDARTLTINGTAYDLTADRSWTISGSDPTKLPLTGGTLTGDLIINKTGGSTLTLGQGTSTNDYGRVNVYGKATGSGVSLLYMPIYNTQSGSAVISSAIEVAHEGTSADNKSFFTLKLHNGTSLITPLSIASSGAATFSNSITATSIIKSGGTSSQFLKADGSIDSNTYLTTSSASSTYLALSGGTMSGTISTYAAEAFRMYQGSGFISGWNSANTTRQGYLQFAASNAYLYTENGSALNLGVNGATKIYASTNGNVGINNGQSTPLAPLHVGGDTRTTGLQLNTHATNNQGHRIYSRTLDVNSYTTATAMRFTVAGGYNVMFTYEITFHASRLSGTFAELWYLRYTAAVYYNTGGSPSERWWDLREQAGNGIAGVGRNNNSGNLEITASAFDTADRMTVTVSITCNNWDAVTVTFP